MNEPVTDAARGILDGHIVLSRALANRNQYPAIDVLASISRVMSDVTTPEHRKISNEIKKAMAIYKDSEDLINIGAYVRGSSEKIDYAISVIDNIIGFLEQGTYDNYSYEEICDLLGQVLK
jgi:flagellum-specific ATP synthase